MVNLNMPLGVKHVKTPFLRLIPFAEAFRYISRSVIRCSMRSSHLGYPSHAFRLPCMVNLNMSLRRHEINFSSKSPNLPYLPRFKLRQDFWTRNKEKIMNHSEIRIMGRYPNDIEKRNGRQNINSHSSRLFLFDLMILNMPTLLQWKETVD